MSLRTFASYRLALAAMCCAGAVSAQAAVLAHESVSILSSGGAGGSGATTSDMVFATYGADGWGWAGGAGGVQGSSSITNTGGYASPANEALKFSVGSIVDSLNSTYGVGLWSVDNVTLNFNSSYAKQNNSRFGVGSGTFDIYWVGNDSWAQSKGMLSDHALNPVYAASASGLLSWSGSQSLLGSENFTVPSGGSGYVNLNYSLDLTSALVHDIESASASGSNSAVSLYLMGTSSSLGMIIFTGGQSQTLPTLSFDVIAVPEPSSYVLLMVGLVAVGWVSSRRMARHIGM